MWSEEGVIKLLANKIAVPFCEANSDYNLEQLLKCKIKP